MRERAQREVQFQPAAQFSDEGLPHQAPRRVVREWEINRFIEEFLELLLVTFLRFRSTGDDRNAGLVCDPLGAPLRQRLFDTLGESNVILLGLLLTTLLFLFSGPDLLSLIDVDQRRLVLFCDHEHHSNHLLSGSYVISKFAVNVHRGQIEYHRLGLVSDRADHLGLTGACRAIEEEGPHELGEPLPNEQRPKWEDNILSHKLPN